MKTIIVILLLVAAVSAGWFARSRLVPSDPAGAAPAAPAARKVLYYQSAMHPWIKSDQPGRCTICGMELTPVYEGEKGFDAGSDIVFLTQSQVQVLHVQTMEARKQPLTRTLLVAGAIDDDDTRHRVLSAYADGRIEKLKINYIGAEVTEGQPLADIYSPSLLLAESEYVHLLKSGTAEPASVAGARVKLERMGLGAAQIAELPQKPPTVSTSELLAPMSGTVVSKSVYEGQYVNIGQKLFEIADFSIMWFLFRAYEQDMPWIKIGQTVEVTTPSLPGKIFAGTVTFIEPTFDEATRSTNVRVELPNPVVDGRRLLLHRLYADGHVRVDSPEVLSVPRSAVIETGEEAVVYVEQDGGAYARKPVRLGRHGNTLVEILDGLQEGDRVVTNGNLLIDSQAEMNRSFMAPPEPPATPALSSVTPDQNKALSDFLAMADTLADALSMDDLDKFNKAAHDAGTLAGKLATAMKERKDLGDTPAAMVASAALHPAKDLPEARVEFHHFSTTAVPLLEKLRKAGGVPEFQVWECFMVDRVIEGAPKAGRWIQTRGRPGHNPFFGSDMLECAKEIKP